MELNNIDNLVVCSTLNQITNHLVIKALNPKNIFNITFDEECRKAMDMNIKISDWDKNLKIMHDNVEDFVILESGDMFTLSQIKEKILTAISTNGLSDKEIYWHITGGQRTIALAISQILIGDESDNYKGRPNDKILYIEGNSERLIICDSKSEYEDDIDYSNNTLNLETALNLMGLKGNDLKASCEFINKGEFQVDIENDDEHYYYMDLYSKICNKETFEFEGETDTIRNFILKSNKKKTDDERREYIKKLFKELDNPDYKYKIYEDSTVVEQGYPAGYILERLAAHEIYHVLSENKSNNNIVQMLCSSKIFLEGFQNHIDELDIVLLTSTGKIINFECKSGDMSGDNAKSTRYTTYRLSGVFGMPILISPLYENEAGIKEEDKKLKELLKHQKSAYRSAKRAELEIIEIDQIESKMRSLLHIL